MGLSDAAMPQGTPGFEREDALACADVLGGFGVSSAAVRDRIAETTAGTPTSAVAVSSTAADDGDDDLERALCRALAVPAHPTAFVRRAIVASPRGVDAPARFWTTAPETQLGDVFAAIDWTFDVRSANGRSLSIDDAEPYRLRVEDAQGRARSTEFSFPDTPLGDDNYPALVHAINTELLYGLDCRFVQLSDGTDRWRFALVETDDLDRLQETFGARVEPFDRPVLAAAQPDAYVPDADGGADEDVPVPSWAEPRPTRSWRGRRLTAEAFDADHVGGLPHLHDPSDADAGTAEVDAEGADEVIRFVGDDDGSDGSDDDGTGSRVGSSATTASDPVVVPDAEPGEDATSASGATDVRSNASTEDDDLDGWSIGGTVDATTTSTRSTDDDANAVSTSGFSWDQDADASDSSGDDAVRAGASTGASESASDDPGTDAGDADADDGFFSADAAASFDAGAKTSRVTGDSFGVDAGEQTADDQFAAVGAAIAAPARISCRGLLDDDEFLPRIPRAEPAETRLTFEDEFDPTATAADERETDDGFVWVNESSSLGEDRTNAGD